MASGRTKHINGTYLYEVLRGALVALCFGATFAIAAPTLTPIQRIDVRNALTDTAVRVVQSIMLSHGLTADPGARVEVDLAFDEDRLKADAEAHDKTWDERRRAESAGQRQALREMAKELEERKAETPPSPAGAEATKNGMRLGRLNIDLSADTMKRMLDRPATPTSDSRALPLSLQLQAPQVELVTPPFQYEPRNYVAWMTIKVGLPASAPAEIDAVLTAALIAAFELKSFPTAKPEAELVKIDRLPPAAAKGPTLSGWARSLVEPQNPLVGQVLIALIAALALVLGARALAKGARGIAQEIKGLKPEAAASEGGAAGEAAVDQGHAVVDAEAVDADARSSYDTGHTARALTAEMQNLREQIADMIANHQQIFVELLRDMLDTPTGLVSFKDLLGFVGYRTLKPAMDALSPTAIRRLQDFVESAQDTPPNLLNGAEAVQRLYGNCISKISLGSDATPAMTELRAALVRTEDEQLMARIPDLAALEVAALLRALTVERGNRLMRKVPPDRLREACVLLESDWGAEGEAIIRSLAASLSDQSARGVANKGEQRRLVLRLARSVSLDDEAAITGLIDADDWELKRALYSTRFLYSETPLLPAKQLRAIANSFDLSSRAELIVVASEGLREAVVALYPAGSKQREMLDAELALVEKNAARNEEARKRRLKTLGTFMERVRKAVEADPAIVDLVILKQCELQSLTPPADLAEAFALLSQPKAAA